MEVAPCLSFKAEDFDAQLRAGSMGARTEKDFRLSDSDSEDEPQGNVKTLKKLGKRKKAVRKQRLHTGGNKLGKPGQVSSRRSSAENGA